MTAFVARTCTELPTAEQRKTLPPESLPQPKPLSDFRDEPMYVLLGDPGMGKTTAFEQECEELRTLGEKAQFIDARDFLTFEPGRHLEWQGRTLFIDGLDEVRAGASDGRTPLDRIRGRLDALGRPRFRISCREADWLGDNDLQRLAEVAAGGEVATLRLDPLKSSDIEQILGSTSEVVDPSAFIENARRHGVDGLLENPQTLIFLTKAVRGRGDWPENRTETFEMACGELAKERNEEHSLGADPPPPERLLHAAGYLCAAQLLNGAAGFSTGHLEDEPEFIALDECDHEDRALLRHALATNLFTAVREKTERHFEPVHRQVAEFLGARYLGQCIEDGLSARRVVALMSGPDSVVVTELRGLAGWLAALCSEARDLLIERNPVGVALYGDLTSFAIGERVKLLEAIGRNDTLTLIFRDIWHEPVSALEALVARDMESRIRDLLSAPSRDPGHQGLIRLVLILLARQRHRLAGLAPLLLDVVRDKTWASDIRSSALDAFLHFTTGESGYTTELTELLNQIRDGAVSDPDHEMCGALLWHLYPQEIHPANVWRYLSARESQLIGRYWSFWENGVLAESSDKDVAELLDYLVDRRREVHTALGALHVNSLPARLMERGLAAYESNIEPPRLYRWLRAAAPPFGHSSWRDPKDSALQNVRNWLEERPDLQKAVLTEGLTRIPDDDSFFHEALEVWEALHGSKKPPDFAAWCLEKAIDLEPSHSEAAKYLLGEAHRALREQRDAEGLTLDVLQERVRGYSALEEELLLLVEGAARQEAGVEYDIPDWLRERREKARQERAQERQAEIDYIRDNAKTLSENLASISLLNALGQAYFFYEADRGWGGSPKHRDLNLIDGLTAYVGNDPDTLDAVLAGLQGVPWRDDFPSCDKILRLKDEKMRHLLDFACVASLDLLHERNSDRFASLSQDQAETGLAFYYSTGTLHLEAPAWYETWSERIPETVMGVTARCVHAAICRGDNAPTALNALWQFKGPSELRYETALELLSEFPAKANSNSLAALDYLLWIALTYSDRSAFVDLIDKKLATKSMGMAQRVRWMTAGGFADPETYAAQLKEFARGSQRRARELAEFIETGSRLAGSPPPLAFAPHERSAAALGTLVSLLGCLSAPYTHVGLSVVQFDTSLLVENLLKQLAEMPGDDALQELEALATDPGLAKWRGHLEQIRDEQRVVRRDAAYRHPSLDELHRALSDNEPANVADLAALGHDRLVTIRAEMRATNTDDWRLYWKEDRPEPPETPKHEESCRDVLLFQLRPHLPSGVDAQPEGQHAGDKRSDIRVAHEVGIVPVEIKKNAHQTLWSALRSQLIEQYASDADASGYGIYVVLWFGAGFTQPPPSGKKPQTPAELERRLRDTLTPDEARKIEVVVLDVSPVSSHQSVAAAA